MCISNFRELMYLIGFKKIQILFSIKSYYIKILSMNTNINIIVLKIIASSKPLLRVYALNAILFLYKTTIF